MQATEIENWDMQPDPTKYHSCQVTQSKTTARKSHWAPKFPSCYPEKGPPILPYNLQSSINQCPASQFTLLSNNSLPSPSLGTFHNPMYESDHCCHCRVPSRITWSRMFSGSQHEPQLLPKPIITSSGDLHTRTVSTPAKSTNKLQAQAPCPSVQQAINQQHQTGQQYQQQQLQHNSTLLQ